MNSRSRILIGAAFTLLFAPLGYYGAIGLVGTVVDQRLSQPHGPGYFEIIQAPPELSRGFMRLNGYRSAIYHNRALLHAMRTSPLGYDSEKWRLEQTLHSAYMQTEYRLSSELCDNLWLFMQTQTDRVRGNHTVIVFYNEQGSAIGLAPWPPNEDHVAFHL